VEPCREVYNPGIRLDIFKPDFELVSVMELSGEIVVRSDDLSENIYDLFLGNLTCWGGTGDPISGDGFMGDVSD
jgi:hypothetical protein